MTRKKWIRDRIRERRRERRRRREESDTSGGVNSYLFPVTLFAFASLFIELSRNMLHMRIYGDFTMSTVVIVVLVSLCLAVYGMLLLWDALSGRGSRVKVAVGGICALVLLGVGWAFLPITYP